jgi:hypothetical protein
LEQLAAMTVLSIDSGDIHTIEKFAATGLITDATTNPLFGEFFGGGGQGGVRARAGCPVCVCRGGASVSPQQQ